MDIDGIYYCSRCMRKVEDDAQSCPHCGYDPANVTVNNQHLAEGTFLNDRYLLGAVIGAGGFGVTYAAWDENLSVPVAIKEYFPVKYAYRNIEDSDELLPYEESRGMFALGLSRFRKEAQVLAQFQNVPGIVNINECFDENETAYIAMEFVHGVPLDEYVREHHPSPKKLLEIMLPAINALEIIHRQGINHRDIKPENLLVQEDGSIKLIDFGSAREVEHVTNLIVVSDGYAPLEQYDLKQPQGPWVDVYGISATIYHMLTGVMPEASISRAKNDTLKAPSKLGMKLKKYQEKALIAGLVVDPKKRIQSIAEFRALLYNMPLPEEVRRRKAFVRKVVSVVVVIILLMAAAFVNFAIGFPLGEGLLYSLYPDGWHIVGTLREVADVDVPNTRLGIPISAISRETFRHNSTLDSILVPSNVREIGPYAFADCESLSMVTLSAGVEAIHSFAFSDCPSLHTIYLPDSIQQLDSTAFEGHGDFLTVWGNTALNHLLPEGVNLADRAAYTVTENTTGLTLAYCILLPSQSDVVLPSYIDGRPITHVSENALGETIPEWVSSITFPYYMDTIYPWSGGSIVKQGIEMVYGDEVVTIASHAFEHATFTSFEFPPKLKEIGERAFMYSALTEVDLPDTVQKVGESAFAYCEALTKVDLSSSIATLEDSTFSSCSSLTDIRIPEGIVEIEPWCFYGCLSLQYLWLPDSLEYLSLDNSLPDSLEYLYLPENVILPCPFSNCTDLFSYSTLFCLPQTLMDPSIAMDIDYTFVLLLPEPLRYLYLPEYMDYASVMSLVGPLQYLYVPDIADPTSAMYRLNCKSTIIASTDTELLTNMHERGKLYDDVRTWNIFPAADTPGAITIDVGTTAEATCASFDIANNVLVTTVYTTCSTDQPILQSVKLPSTVQTLGGSAFQNCTELTHIDFPSSLKSILGNSFTNTGLVNVSLPHSLEYLGPYSFNENTFLEEVRIHCDTLSNSFQSCPSLRTVWIDTANMTWSMNNCDNLSEVIITGDLVMIYHCFSDSHPVKVFHKEIGDPTYTAARHYWIYDAQFIEVTASDLLFREENGYFPNHVQNSPFTTE